MHVPLFNSPICNYMKFTNIQKLKIPTNQYMDDFFMDKLNKENYNPRIHQLLFFFMK